MKKFSCASRTTDMTQKTFPKPQPYHAGAAFLTLFEKEVLRFRKIALQTVLAPVIMGVMYLAVFGELLDDKMATFEGVTYTRSGAGPGHDVASSKQFCQQRFVAIAVKDHGKPRFY